MALLGGRKVLLGAVEPVFLTPASYPGLALWLDASDTTTTFQDSVGGTPATADTNPVGAWNDKSNSNNDATEGTNKPILKLAIQNSLSVIRFDGTNDLLTCGSQIAQPPLTFFAVWQALTPAAKGFCLGGGGARLHNGRDLGGTFFYRTGGATEQSTAGNDNFNVHSGLATSGTQSFWLNGSAAASSAYAAPGGTTLALGLLSGGTNPLGCDLGEVIIYTRELSTYRRRKVEAYLGAKWGITVT